MVGADMAIGLARAGRKTLAGSEPAVSKASRKMQEDVPTCWARKNGSNVREERKALRCLLGLYWLDRAVPGSSRKRTTVASRLP